MLLAPLLVLSRNSPLSQFADTLTVPEGGYKVHPLLPAVHSGWAGKQTIRVWKSAVKQGNQVAFEHGPYFGALFVLPVCGF